MALKRLNENEQSRLDGQLQSLLQSLVQKPPEPDDTIIGKARDIITSQVGKLMRPSWEASWETGYLDGAHRKGFVASAWFEAESKVDAESKKVLFEPKDEKEADELHAVFTRLVAYVKAADPDDRQDATTNLKIALRRYLRLRGYNVESSAAAPGPATGGEAATATQLDGPESQANGPIAPSITVWHHRDRSYSLDGSLPVVVSQEEANILTAFRNAGTALDTRALGEHVSNVARVIKQLEEKFPRAVRKPQRKGERYYICVRLAPEQPTCPPDVPTA